MRRIATAMLAVAAAICAPVAGVSQEDAPAAPSEEGPGVGSDQGGLSPEARSAVAEERKALANRARRRIRTLIERLCPGRCELVDLNVEMQDPEIVGSIEPGFESKAGQAYDMEAKSISMTVLLDSALPSNFQQNFPRMIEYQLKNLAPEIQVRRESLSFPKPQNRPSPPAQKEPPRPTKPPPKLPKQKAPPPQPEPEPEEPDKQESDDDEEAEEERSGFWQGLWTFLEELAPWLGPILMMVVLFLLGLALFRRFREMAEGTAAGASPTGGAGESTSPPSAEQLRAELTESRAVKNRVLRDWLQDDPEGVANLVRLLGPGILDDLKSDEGLNEEVEEVSEIVARHQEPLSDEEIERVAHEARARLNAAQIRHEDTELAAEWEFLEGIDIATLRRVLDSCNTREKLHVMGKLPQTLRGSYLESLDSDERRELFLASDSGELDKQSSRELAARLRKTADQYGHVGAEAEGRAELVVDMLESLDLDEQVQSLLELYDTRPEVAESVLSKICLETACTKVPKSVLANAIHRTPMDTLTTFLRGTREQVVSRVLEVAPRQKRDDLRTELSLDVPVGKSEFLSARERFMDVVRESIRREGHELVEANLEALREGAGATPQQGEVAE